jgi:hypothetical protein
MLRSTSTRLGRLCRSLGMQQRQSRVTPSLLPSQAEHQRRRRQRSNRTRRSALVASAQAAASARRCRSHASREPNFAVTRRARASLPTQAAPRRQRWFSINSPACSPPSRLLVSDLNSEAWIVAGLAPTIRSSTPQSGQARLLRSEREVSGGGARWCTVFPSGSNRRSAVGRPEGRPVLLRGDALTVASAVRVSR